LLSVLIPAKSEVYLERTIRNVLDNAQGEIEILVCLDAWKPDPPIDVKDDRVIFHYFKDGIGQRGGINALAKVAKGTYIMKLDAHCAVDEGFDVKLAENCEYDWTVIPRMYNLDHETWLPKLRKVTDYMFISSPTGDKPFRASYYDGPHTPKGMKKLRQPKGPDIDDIMCCMGPAFFMHKDRFWELEGCDEGHGSWGQQGIEVALKAWLSGGRLVVNKNTWFAHWFRGDVGFPYEASGKAQEEARRYSQDLWLNDKWHLAKRPLSWVIEKFDPPGWGKSYLTNNQITDLNRTTYRHIHKGKRYPRWMGHEVLKDPNDLILYQQVIFENMPDFIIETGTKHGGSTTFLADICSLNGHGHVISIDIKAQAQPEHPRITYLNGSSKDIEIVNQVKEIIKDGTVMVILDSDHSRRHVKWELHRYAPLVTPGQYIVVEDCYSSKMTLTGPGEARDWFMTTKLGKEFKNVPLSEQFITGLARDGWLLRC